MARSSIPYCPWQPTEKQRQFLQCDEVELFYGGAAGGGKSVALLMGALQYVDRPGYAALILRKDLPRLALAGGLIPRSHQWLQNTEARWNHSRRQWSFPVEDGPPATLTFGYLSRPLDKFRYASSEFQYIAFDELTDFAEDDYLFLFSRLRRPRTLRVPLRMRAAGNPGGVGHLWVKRRFIPEALAAGIDGPADAAAGQSEADGVCLPGGMWRKAGRLFLPARIADNPALDEAEYRQTLAHLPPVERERLMNGDWQIQEQGLIQAAWLRYFVENGRQLELLGPDGRALAVVAEGTCYRFATIDPAGTSAERTREARGAQPSWTVVQVWDQPPREYARFLLLRAQLRERAGFPRLCEMIRTVHARFRPERLWIEGEKLGRAAVDTLGRELPIDCLGTQGKDKVTRAAALIVKLERGEVFLPRHNSTWLPALEAEWLAWTGDARQPADQIDAAAYAAIVAQQRLGEPIRLASELVRS
jgi:phage terminase large subunit-like protein